MKYQATNTGKAARGLATMSGKRWIRSGETATVDLDETQAERARRFVAIAPVAEEAPTVPNDAGYSRLTEDQLRDLIEQRTGKRPHHRAGRAKLIEALA